jgi:beta-ureidopropionase / N-carbamoyl-L-amino-acid hydrolase
MVSGAGHDAVHLSRLCPTGMVFIPCLGGRSHRPEEWASKQHVGNGSDTLLQTLIELDRLLSQ